MTRAQHDEAVRALITPRIEAVETNIATALSLTLDAVGLTLGATPQSVARTLVAWIAGLVLRRGLGGALDARDATVLLPPVMTALLG